jgi:hypothetical protein
MDVYSDSDIQAFRQHATLYYNENCSCAEAGVAHIGVKIHGILYSILCTGEHLASSVVCLIPRGTIDDVRIILTGDWVDCTVSLKEMVVMIWNHSAPIGDWTH